MHAVRSLLASFIALAFVSTAAAAAAERHPFSVEDLVRLQRVSDPALSPDGKTVVYVVRETDLAANRGRQDLWSLDIVTKGAQPRRLTSNPENDNSPAWSRDGRYVYFISSRGGSAQVWRLPAAGGEAEQVTSLPLDVGSFRLAPDATALAVSMDVFAGCEDLPCTTARVKQAEDSKASGKIYDRTFVRHWDTWDDGRISQLFVLRMENGRAVEPRALTAALDADVPSKPFGDASEYTFSPDGSKVVFDARIKGKSEPWSTNFDLYEVSVEGGEPRNLTADNPAWDAQPVFSPDGSMLAWRAMRRPGFEADRFHVMVMDLKSGERRELAQDWDRSADQIEFSADNRTLYAVADHFGQRPVWAIDVKTGKTNDADRSRSRRRLRRRRARDRVRGLDAEVAGGVVRGHAERRRPARAAAHERRRVLAAADRRAGAIHVRGRERRNRVRLRDAPGELRSEAALSGRVHRARRPAIVVRERVELSLESADVRGRRLRLDLHRFPRLARLRPGVHRFDQPGLGRQAARGSAEGSAGGARPVPVAGRRAHVRARRFVRRLHDELDRRQLERAVQVHRQPRRHLRHARHGLHDRRAVVQRVGERRHAVGRGGELREVQPAQPRQGLEEADAGDRGPERLSRAVLAEPVDVQRAAAARHSEPPAGLPERESLGAEAREQHPVASRSREVARPVDGARRGE